MSYLLYRVPYPATRENKGQYVKPARAYRYGGNVSQDGGNAREASLTTAENVRKSLPPWQQCAREADLNFFLPKSIVRSRMILNSFKN